MNISQFGLLFNLFIVYLGLSFIIKDLFKPSELKSILAISEPNLLPKINGQQQILLNEYIKNQQLKKFNSYYQQYNQAKKRAKSRLKC